MTCAREGCERAALRNREVCNSHWRKWRYKNDPEYRARRVKRNRENQLRDFSLTPEEYAEMLAAQGGVCAICKGTTPNKNLAVDHDHACCPDRGKSCGDCVRGLLCLQCNTKLGWFEANKEAVLSYDSKWFRGTHMTASVGVTS